MTRFIFMLISATCVSMFTDVVFAQEDATSGGTLRGQITDITLRQNPIEGVEIKIVAQDGGKEWTTKTDADGNYKHAGLPAGRYLISISKDGYDRRVWKFVTIVDGGDHFVPHKMAQKGNIEPFFEVQQKRKDITIKQEIKPRVESLLQGIAESVSRRYDLDTAAADTLRLSILEAVEIVLKRDRSIHFFAKAVEGGSVGLLKVLLSRLDCKVLFAKHLSKAQLQDYVNFTEARQQLDQQAVARWITAALDRELSLTADQRKNLEQLLLDTTANAAFPTSMRLLEIDILEAVHLVNDKLKISLDGLLTQTQYDILNGVFAKNAMRGNEVGETEFQLRLFAEAKLTTHTKLLGHLDEDASRRLTVAIKGTVQQYFEARDKEAETMFHKVEAALMGLVESGEMKREHAVEELNDMRRDLGNEEGVIRRQPPHLDIIMHPLFQQAIKDALSEEAFAQYTARQTERDNWHQQALRDVAVASLGTQLILDDTQRKKLETTAAELTVDLWKTDAARDMFYQLLQRTDQEILSPWQQETLTSMHAGFEREFRK